MTYGLTELNLWLLRPFKCFNGVSSAKEDLSVCSSKFMAYSNFKFFCTLQSQKLFSQQARWTESYWFGILIKRANYNYNYNYIV